MSESFSKDDAMPMLQEKSGEVDKDHKSEAGGTSTKRFRGAFAKIQAVRNLSGRSATVFGDLGMSSADGSVDALGAGLQLKDAAAAMMEPQDQIAYARDLNPEYVKAAIAEAAELSGQKRWASLPAEEVAREFGSTTKTGLTVPAAKKLLENVGRNELAKGKSTPFIIVWCLQLKDPTSVIILIASLINYFGLDDKMTGVLMFAYFFVSTFVNAIGEHSSAEGLSALSAMGAACCKVLRDGAEVEVPAAELVPGDIVQIQCGDTLPADMRVSMATDLRIDESVLTGESEEVTKVENPLSGEDVESFPVNMMYSSTAVVAGKGGGIVTATGMDAQVGLIARRLDMGAVGLSPLQKTMNRLGGSVGVVVIAITAAITGLCFYKRYQDPDHLCDEGDTQCFFFRALAQGIVLGLSCVPVTMPMMTNMLLNTARKEIQDKNAVVRKTSSIETLGCCMAICSDKTGTLTEGKMTVIKCITPRVEAIESFAFFPTAGFDPAGGIFKDSELDEKRKKEIQDSITSKGCLKEDLALRRYGNAQTHTDIDDAHIRTLMTATSLNCYATELLKKDGKWVTEGNLSEGALVVGAAKASMGAPIPGLDIEDVRSLFPADVEVEVPFSSARKMMCTVHAVPTGTFAGLKLGQDQSHVAIVKGAPDRLLPMVEMSLAGQADSTLCFTEGLDVKMNEAVLNENTAMAGAALRVLLLCIRALTKDEVEALRRLDADERMKMVTQRLAIVGAFGILDPPRSTVKASIAKCKSAGIRVVMITGDQPATAAAIGEALGIVQDRSQAKLCSVMHTDDGNLLSEAQIDKMVSATSVWARAQPADKVTIIESLQRMGFPAAMTGDGVNDAPALKLADIGTAMGLTGTAVAKGAADIVLMNDDFTTIVDAVQEGRRTFANVQTYVAFYMSMALPEIAVYATCLFAGTPMPLTSLQMLGMNGVSHVIPPLMFACQPLQEDAMNVPPRRKDCRLVPRAALNWLVIPWIVIWWAAWFGHNALVYWMHTGHILTADVVDAEEARASKFYAEALVSDERPMQINGFAMPAVQPQMTPLDIAHGSRIARSMNFITICIAELILVVSFSSERPLAIFTSQNKPLLICASVMLMVAFLAIYLPHVWPWTGEVTGFEPLSLHDLSIATGFAFGAHLLMEFAKIGYRAEIRSLNELRRYHALATSKGLISAGATDAQVEACRAEHPFEKVKSMV